MLTEDGRRSGRGRKAWTWGCAGEQRAGTLFFLDMELGALYFLALGAKVSCYSSGLISSSDNMAGICNPSTLK